MYDFLEVVRRIRTESPDWSSASRYARGFAWICLGVMVWNLVCQFLYAAMPIPEQFRNMFRHPALLSAAALIALAGMVALWASRGLRNRDPIGRLLGKSALSIFCAGVASFLAFFWLVDAILPEGGFGIVLRVVMLLVGCQFLVPVWLAFGYLDRLDPGQEPSFPDDSVQSVDCPDGIFREGLTPLGPGLMMMVSSLGAMLPGLALFFFKVPTERS